MANIIFQVGAKIDTIENCIELVVGQNYSDIIYRNNAYTNTLAGTKLKIRNKCGSSFNIGAQNIFTDTTSGGNFIASIGGITVPGNTTVDVDIRYSGTYKGVNNSPTYTVTVNNTSRNYSLTVLNPDTPPVTSNSTVTLLNRTNTTINKNNLIFSDVDGNDTITGVRFTGDTSKLFTNAAMTTQYISGTELDLATFTLYFKAPDTDASNTYTIQYDVKASGVWSS